MNGEHEFNVVAKETKDSFDFLLRDRKVGRKAAVDSDVAFKRGSTRRIRPRGRKNARSCPLWNRTWAGLSEKPLFARRMDHAPLIAPAPKQANPVWPCISREVSG